MKINIITDIESHDGFSMIRNQDDYAVHGTDLQKVIIAATEKWKGLSVGSISVGFSSTFDKFIALKD